MKLTRIKLYTSQNLIFHYSFVLFFLVNVVLEKSYFSYVYFLKFKITLIIFVITLFPRFWLIFKFIIKGINDRHLLHMK